MGQRANYAVVGEPHLYSSRHAAISLLEDFAAGPDEALAFVRAQDRTDDWWDDIWCEGAAVIDPADHVLLLFTWHHDGVVDRARHLAGIRAAWEGWRVRWAYGGVEDVVAYLGIDRLTVRTERHRPVLRPGAADDLDLTTCLLTVRNGDGLRAYRVAHLFCEPLWAGPELLDVLAAERTVSSWERLSKDDVGPDLGVHIDLARRELGFWTATTYNGSLADIAACWPGWRVEFWEDRHEEHTRRCGADFAMYRFEGTS
ncbi:hypothetical protein BBK82_10225 [Lentzea guizhouensis]|uniref:Uncharacterized protein n=1 Tax=Lentzea guizhouensis TaxID=1586287 RepID=A0A1B2HF97_9PSEU|nr:hypothetical protein [Lentzea guizhouensis]ANZ36382.1 hypothetical protein BBK82_10225 [Lentzea guizhouensis]